MKTIITIFIILLTINSSGIYSQTDTAKKQIYIIKTDLLTPIVGLFVGGKCAILTLETGFKKRHTFQLTTGYARQTMKFAQDNFTGTYSNFWTIVINPEYKYFISKKRNYTGLYIGGSLFWRNSEDQEVNYYNWPMIQDEISLDYIENDIAVGPIIGYQNYFKHFVYDFMVGTVYCKSIALKFITNPYNIDNP